MPPPRSPAPARGQTRLSGPRLHRRHLLQAGALAGASLMALAPRDAAAARLSPFQHGVASGDPLPDGIILWTRVTPSPDAQPGSGVGPVVRVRWELSDAPDFARLVGQGEVLTGAEMDHTVKVDVRGLRPSTRYYYRFRALKAVSPVGRFRTAPAPDAEVPRLRFGLVSCANYEAGFFAAYRHLAMRDDLDVILHLGDYLYEYGNGRYGDLCAPTGRCHLPATEMVSLADYRQRHATYKRDPDLQALHASCAFVVTWDDHETTNDSWREGAENHQPETEGDFQARRAAAARAYREWMPLRTPDPAGEQGRIYRSLRFGRLAELHMLDLRSYRDAQVASADAAGLTTPARTLTGRAQMEWLKTGLERSPARWKLVGNPVQLMPIRVPALPEEVAQALTLLTGSRVVPEGGAVFNADTWDGYLAEQRELLGHLQVRGVRDVVFLTGDIHSSWAADLPVDPGTYPLSPSVATEYVTTSVTSDNLDDILGAPPRTASLPVEAAFLAANRHIQLLEFDSHGFAVGEATPERLQVDWFYVSDRADPLASLRYGQSFAQVAGSNRVARAAGPLPPRPSADLDTTPLSSLEPLP